MTRRPANPASPALNARNAYRPPPEMLEDRLTPSTVVGDFESAGLWRYTDDSGWQFLTPASPNLVAATDDGSVVGDFGDNGIWRFTNWFGWQFLTPENATQLGISN